jgi:hypothetical protein
LVAFLFRSSSTWSPFFALSAELIAYARHVIRHRDSVSSVESLIQDAVVSGSETAGDDTLRLSR